jgi:hypothetical protein
MTIQLQLYTRGSTTDRQRSTETRAETRGTVSVFREQMYKERGVHCTVRTVYTGECALTRRVHPQSLSLSYYNRFLFTLLSALHSAHYLSLKGIANENLILGADGISPSIFLVCKNSALSNQHQIIGIQICLVF